MGRGVDNTSYFFLSRLQFVYLHVLDGAADHTMVWCTCTLLKVSVTPQGISCFHGNPYCYHGNMKVLLPWVITETPHF